MTWRYLCLVGSKDDSYMTSEFPEVLVNLQSPLRVLEKLQGMIEADPWSHASFPMQVSLPRKVERRGGR